MTTNTVPPPPAAAPLPAAPLDIVDTVLGNGLRVIAARRPTVPVVQLRLGVPFGGTDPLHAATAELLTATLLAGTRTRDRAALDDELAEVGGSLKAVVGPETLRISGQCLAPGLPRLLAALADSLTGAAYDTPLVEAERTALLDRVRITESMPGNAARTALLRRCFGNHPATRETPTATEVAEIARDRLPALHRAQLVPRGAVPVLVGDLLADQASALAEELLAGWTATNAAVPMRPLPVLTGTGITSVHRAAARQCEVRFAATAPALHDPVFPALHLADQVFGGYFSARLAQNLRERRGWIYRRSPPPAATPWASGPS